MAKTVADQFVEALAAAGVKRIYGIVGDSLNGLTDVVNEQSLASVLESPRTPHQQCRALADMASDAGATDDVTVMVAHYGVTTPRTSV